MFYTSQPTVPIENLVRDHSYLQKCFYLYCINIPKILEMKMCSFSWLLSDTSLITIRKQGGHSYEATQSIHFSDGADIQQGEGEVLHSRSLYSLAERELGGENPKEQSGTLPLFLFRSQSTNRSFIHFPIDFFFSWNSCDSFMLFPLIFICIMLHFNKNISKGEWQLLSKAEILDSDSSESKIVHSVYGVHF